MKCHFKIDVTQNGISLKIECHSKWIVTEKGLWNVLKTYCHSKYDVTHNGMSHKKNVT